VTPARPLLAVAASAAAALALCAPAGAATVSTVACVRSYAPSVLPSLPVAASGFVPGSLVTVKYTSAFSPAPSFLTSGTADPTGSFRSAVVPPAFKTLTTATKLGTTRQTFSLLASDNVNPLAIATSTFGQVLVSWSTSPASGAPGSLATHTARGFVTGKSVYLHYRFGGKPQADVSLGRAAGPCGIVSKRLRQVPAPALHTGLWTVYVDQRRSYSSQTKLTELQLKYTFPIRVASGTR